jgi:hypothetical protein
MDTDAIGLSVEFLAGQPALRLRPNSVRSFTGSLDG